MRSAFIATGNQLLTRSGREPLNPTEVAWESKDLALVATLREFDGLTADPAPNIRYVGPIFEGRDPPLDWQLPWALNDPRPLVLVSFSTMPGQTAPGTPQLVLDVLRDLPVRVLMTTGAVPTSLNLAVPDNAAVYEFVPHSAVLPSAAMTINHAGHGSVMTALACGVPLVCMPSRAADQPIVAARVEALGAGRAVGGEPTAAELEAAIVDVLARPTYRSAAQRLARMIAHEDGALSGASAIESLLIRREAA
jgi:MGT family glycosyltransferase